MTPNYIPPSLNNFNPQTTIERTGEQPEKRTLNIKGSVASQAMQKMDRDTAATLLNKGKPVIKVDPFQTLKPEQKINTLVQKLEELRIEAKGIELTDYDDNLIKVDEKLLELSEKLDDNKGAILQTIKQNPNLASEYLSDLNKVTVGLKEAVSLHNEMSSSIETTQNVEEKNWLIAIQNQNKNTNIKSRLAVTENIINKLLDPKNSEVDTAFNSLSVEKKVDSLINKLNTLGKLAEESSMTHNGNFGIILSNSSKILELSKAKILAIANQSPKEVNAVLNNINENSILLKETIDLQDKIIRDNPPGLDIYDISQEINQDNIRLISRNIYHAVLVVSGVNQSPERRNESEVIEKQPRMEI
ncbi:MAG: hypothetical protein HRT47_00555 [Candidatus Caenarcaniphilales bacterium]|nr:hypothetical protein [Candidatus Caenarcaniphilales bacterium]